MSKKKDQNFKKEIGNKAFKGKTLFSSSILVSLYNYYEIFVLIFYI